MYVGAVADSMGCNLTTIPFSTADKYGTAAVTAKGNVCQWEGGSMSMESALAEILPIAAGKYRTAAVTDEGDVYMWEGWSKPLEPGQLPPRTNPTAVPAVGSQLPPLVPVNHPLPGAAFQGALGQSPPSSASTVGFAGAGPDSKGTPKGAPEASPGDSGRKWASESGSRRKHHKKSWRSFEQIRPERYIYIHGCDDASWSFWSII